MMSNFFKETSNHASMASMHKLTGFCRILEKSLRAQQLKVRIISKVFPLIHCNYAKKLDFCLSEGNAIHNFFRRAEIPNSYKEEKEIVF